jgi:hypothetical protein
VRSGQSVPGLPSCVCECTVYSDFEIWLGDREGVFVNKPAGSRGCYVSKEISGFILLYSVERSGGSLSYVMCYALCYIH